MIIHFKDKDHPSFPKAACGFTSITMIHTNILNDITCKNCIKSINNKNNDSEMSGRDYERTNLQYRRTS